MRSAPSSLAVAAWLALGGAVVAGACDNQVRDSHCTPDGDDDDCIYSPEGRGPGIKEPVCATPSAAEEVPADCPDFFGVLGFMEDPGQGNCSALGCHGSEATAAIDIHFPVGDACGTYKALYLARGSVGRAYLTPDLPDTEENEALQSWMYCSVTGMEGGGFPMPKPGGVPYLELADVVRRFILCGAPPPDGCDLTGGT